MTEGDSSPDGNDTESSLVCISRSTRPRLTHYSTPCEKSLRTFLDALRLTEVKVKTYGTVRNKYESPFPPHCNIIYERSIFNMRKQDPHAEADTLIADIHNLSDRYDYGSLKEDLIRDRIVIVLLD